MKILITGISGKLAQQVAVELCARGHELTGIDRRPWPDAPQGVQLLQTDIRKPEAEELFRSVRPDAVIHMATVSHLTTRRDERYRINLGGTQKVFEYCEAHGVAHALFVGRHTYYGAVPDAALYRTEDEPPMALESFPEPRTCVRLPPCGGSPAVSPRCCASSTRSGRACTGRWPRFSQDRVCP